MMAINFMGPDFLLHSKATAMLQTPELSARNLMCKMNVKAVCTTDDPAACLWNFERLGCSEMRSLRLGQR